MKKRVGQKHRMRMLAAVVLALACAAGAAAQQAPQPITHYVDYTIKPGKEADFMELVSKVGAPVRDKLMKEGVVLAWGVDVPMVRGVFGSTTHTVWYAVMDWASIEKVQTAMAAQFQKVMADEAKAAEEATKKRQKPAPGLAERLGDIADMSQTRDFFTRDIVFGSSSAPMTTGMQIFTRYNFVQAKPGKGGDYRAAWEKYNKPVLESLAKDGTILAFGLGVEEVKTTNTFTHYSWYAMTNLGATDKLRTAFMADRAKRSQEERDAISATFRETYDPTASRGLVMRSLIFREGSMK
ncbi:MAG: hypothetical protein M1453_03005 [Acidobacteria bacterium]|nr:hypothetical protein [Acidobacteriota bacterium]MCL5286950.1 hypothetical protein [Acidobacteriota bacterium]